MLSDEIKEMIKELKEKLKQYRKLNSQTGLVNHSFTMGEICSYEQLLPKIEELEKRKFNITKQKEYITKEN